MTAEERQKMHDLEEENARLKSSLEQRDVFIRRTMASFLSDEVLEEVLESGKSVRIGGERRVVTMMFSDIRRSTQLSESMNATDFIDMLNHYLEEMIEIVNSWQGNILSFVGDAIVTVFGAPRPNEDAARDAVACAVAMQRRMPMVNVWNEEHGYPHAAGGRRSGNSEPGRRTLGQSEGHPDGHPDPRGDRLRKQKDPDGRICFGEPCQVCSCVGKHSCNRSAFGVPGMERAGRRTA